MLHAFERIEAAAIYHNWFALRQVVVPAALPDHVKLGHAGIHKPRLNLADYVAADVKPPPAVHRSHLGNPYLRDPLGNTDWGDCGEAMTLHGIEAFHLDAGTPVPVFVTDDALGLYSAVGKFDPTKGPPGNNPTDNGTDNSVLFPYWENDGVKCAADGSTHKIAGSLFVDPADQRLSKIAIWEFVVLFRAIALPITAQGQGRWQLTDPSLKGDAAPGSWGYHDIPYFSFDAHSLRNDSWGVEMLVDWSFDGAYAAQGIVVVTQEQLNLRGQSPAGVNWTKLNADLAAMASVSN